MISRTFADQTVLQVEDTLPPCEFSAPLEHDDSSGTDDNHAWRGVQNILKRVLDVVASSIALAALSPLLLLVGFLIARDSKGPVIFRQRRIGRYGKLFWIFKFRTMVVDAEARQKSLEALNESEGGALFKMKKDPRITPIGAFLRKTSLDELPQLLNVVRGEMSLVGPRPLTQRDYLRLTEIDGDGYRRRLDVLPGISGPWQVAGRSRLGAEQMLKLDTQYVDEWNLYKDIVILFKTIGVVFWDRDGAC